MVKINNPKDLNKFLNNLAKIPAETETVDKIIIGNELVPIKRIGTCWVATLDVLKKAVEEGVNVIVTHEPTFYTHWDLNDENPHYAYVRREQNLEKGEKAYLEQIEKKKQFILDNNLVIIRCHDTMDFREDFGMSKALAEVLGFSEEDLICSKTVYNIYRVNGLSAYDLTKKLAAALKPLNHMGIQFYGDGERIVNSIGIGCGCYCDPILYMEYDADYYLAINDMIKTWVQTVYSADSGLPLGVINHGTSEEMGMRHLSSYIKQETGIDTVHFDGGCDYKLII